MRTKKLPRLNVRNGRVSMLEALLHEGLREQLSLESIILLSGIEAIAKDLHKISGMSTDRSWMLSELAHLVTGRRKVNGPVETALETLRRQLEQGRPTTHSERVISDFHKKLSDVSGRPSIVVFGSASNKAARHAIRPLQTLCEAFAGTGALLVNGSGPGIMGMSSRMYVREIRNHGGDGNDKNVAVVPLFWDPTSWEERPTRVHLRETIWFPYLADISQRTQLLCSVGMPLGFHFFPGGFGTLLELAYVELSLKLRKALQTVFSSPPLRDAPIKMFFHDIYTKNGWFWAPVMEMLKNQFLVGAVGQEMAKQFVVVRTLGGNAHKMRKDPTTTSSIAGEEVRVFDNPEETALFLQRAGQVVYKHYKRHCI